MRDQVARQLERARLAARFTVVGTLIDVPPVVTALARTMEKLHRERDIAIAIDAPEHAYFRGEQQDLEEMVGNLVDNACKWAQSRVAIEVVAERPAGETSRACASSSTMTGRAFRPPSASRWRCAADGSTRASPAPASAFPSSSSSPASTAACSRLGTAPIGGLRAELALPGG